MAESLASHDFLRHFYGSLTPSRPPAIIAPIAFGATLLLTLFCNAEAIYSHACCPLKAPISLFLSSLIVLLPVSAVAAPEAGIAMHGAPRETDGFTHFPYANPDAPKGGRAVFAVQGSFDSLNPADRQRGAGRGRARIYLREPARPRP